MVKQIFRGQDAFSGEHLRNSRANAAHIHDWSIETGHTQDAKAFRSRAV